MQTKKRQITDYLTNKVNIFIEPMVLDIVKNRPADPLTFAQNWIQKYIASKKKSSKKDDLSDSQIDQVQELPFDYNRLDKIKKQGKKNSRIAISQEVFGNFNKKESFIPRVIPKSQQAKVLILSLIRNSIIFQNLDSRDEQVVINAMDVRKVQSGQNIITQGQIGDHLFMVQQGQYICTRMVNGQQKFQRYYNYGDCFGQLAVLYNTPRKTTINCTKSGMLYALDRQTFSHVVKNAASKKRQSHQYVLSKIQIFSQLNSTQRQQFIDVLKEQRFDSGQYVIKQGQKGDKFYIIIDGKLVAQKQQPEGPKIVYHYKQGDYFGQLALIHDISRQASVKCLTSVKVASVQRQSFKRIIGSLQQILKRNQERYKKFQEKLQN